MGLRVIAVFRWIGMSALLGASALGCGEDPRPPTVLDEGPELTGDRNRDRDDPSGEPDAALDDGDEDDGDEQGDDLGGGVGAAPQRPSAGGGDGGSAAATPRVTLISPEDQSGEVPDTVYDETLEVECQVEASAGADGGQVDPSTVVIELVDEAGDVLDSSPGERTDREGVYAASFPVVNLPEGALEVRCSGADTSVTPLTGSADIKVYIDHGPLIEIVSPEEGEAESALGAVAFEYTIDPEKLTSSDESAAVDTAVLSLLGKEFPLEEVEDGVYRTTVDFSDRDIFAQAPSGALLVAVSATNLRGVTRTLRYEFLLDGTGPRVSIESPSDNDIVGGKTELQMKISDSVSGVDWDTLVVQLNDVAHPYEEEGPWTIIGEDVTFTFESEKVLGSVVQINVNVLVEDIAGNASAGASILYYRDEQPPVVMLDPPPFRELDRGECSVPFDPLGISPGHGERVLDLEQYRAMAWDNTNTAPGITVLHLAWVNQNSVDLFARRPGAPLVIDTNDDGICDDIDEEDTRFQELSALKPTGAPTFTEDQEPYTVSEDIECTFADRPTPKALCSEVSDLTVVVGHGVDWDEPLVYAVSPDNDLECTGRQWELRSAGLADYQGWVCLAARAFDNVGNRGVSRPIAVCLDNDQASGLPSCWEDLGEPPPDCASGCEPAPDLGVSQVVYEK